MALLLFPSGSRSSTCQAQVMTLGHISNTECCCLMLTLGVCAVAAFYGRLYSASLCSTRSSVTSSMCMFVHSLHTHACTNELSFAIACCACWDSAACVRFSSTTVQAGNAMQLESCCCLNCCSMSGFVIRALQGRAALQKHRPHCCQQSCMQLWV